MLDDLSTGAVGALPHGVRLVRADICDADALAAAVEGADGIFHLAAVASVEACTNDPEETRRVNVEGTRAVLAARGGRPVVFTSSAAIYGDQAVQPVAETATPAPISTYARDKLASEGLLRADAAAGRGGGVALRPFNVFGPGQLAGSPYSGVITRFAEMAMQGLPLRVNGDGGQTRDFVHVSDIARALGAAMTLAEARSDRFEAINVCSGQVVSVLDLARLVAQLTDLKAAPVFGPARPGDIRASCGDPDRARALLGFSAGVTLEEGLAALFEHMAAPAATP